MIVKNYFIWDQTYEPQETWALKVKAEKRTFGFRRNVEEIIQFVSRQQALEAWPDVFRTFHGTVKEIYLIQIVSQMRYMQATHPTQQATVDWERELEQS